MFTVVYRWRAKPQMDAEFREAWHARTIQLRAQGSYGSRLYVERDGTYCAIALWPSRDAWEAAGSSIENDEHAAIFEASIAERLPATVLELVDDLWLD